MSLWAQYQSAQQQSIILLPNFPILLHIFKLSVEVILQSLSNTPLLNSLGPQNMIG